MMLMLQIFLIRKEEKFNLLQVHCIDNIEH